MEGVARDDSADDRIDIKISRLRHPRLGRRGEADVRARHIAEDKTAVEERPDVAAYGREPRIGVAGSAYREGGVGKDDLRVIYDSVAAENLPDDGAVRLDSALEFICVGNQRRRERDHVRAVFINVDVYRKALDDAAHRGIDQRRVGMVRYRYIGAVADQLAAESVLRVGGGVDGAERDIVRRKLDIGRNDVIRACKIPADGRRVYFNVCTYSRELIGAGRILILNIVVIHRDVVKIRRVVRC